MFARRLLLSVLCATVLGAFARGLRAQSIWLEPFSDRAVYLEILHPLFDSPFGDDPVFPTTVWFFTGRWTLPNQLVVVVDVPAAYLKEEQESVVFEPPLPPRVEARPPSSGIGNIYLGLDWRLRTPQLFGEVGVRLPTADDGRQGEIGLASEVVDRGFEAFLDVFALQGALNYLRRYPSGFAVRVRGAPALLISDDFDDGEGFLLYSGQGWYEAEGVSLGVGLSGRARLTSEFDLDSSTLHQVALFGSLEIGRFRPGMVARVPIDEQGTLDGVIGVTLEVDLN